MSYAAGRIIYDADSHVMETREWMDPFMDADLKAKLRPIYGHKPNRIDKLLDQAKARKGNAEAEAKALENPDRGAQRLARRRRIRSRRAHSGARPVRFLGSARVRHVCVRHRFAPPMTKACSMPARARTTRRWRRSADTTRACSASRMCRSKTRQRALEEVDAAIAAGNRAILVSAGPAGDKSPGHPDFDPMWARLSETNTPFMLHIGPGTKTQPKAFQNNGRARSPDLHGGGENLRFCDYIMLSFAPQVWLTAMVYDGVFERFPNLRGGVIESGAGWAPEFLRELDLGYKSFGRTDPYLQAMPLKPSEYIRRAVKFTPFPGEDVGRMIRDGGADLFMFSSDYPHPEGTNDPKGRFERTMGEFDEDVWDRFYRRNFEEMMSIA